MPLVTARNAMTTGAASPPAHTRASLAIPAAVIALGIAGLVGFAAVMHATVPDDGLDPAPATLAVGSRIPAVSLLDEARQPVALAPLGARASSADRPTLIVVFRGIWCPYCRTQLSR